MAWFGSPAPWCQQCIKVRLVQNRGASALLQRHVLRSDDVVLHPVEVDRVIELDYVSFGLTWFDHNLDQNVLHVIRRSVHLVTDLGPVSVDKSVCLSDVPEQIIDVPL